MSTHRDDTTNSFMEMEAYAWIARMGGCSLDNGALRGAARLMFLSNSPPGETVPRERRTGDLPTRRYIPYVRGVIYGARAPSLTLKCEMSRRHLIVSRCESQRSPDPEVLARVRYNTRRKGSEDDKLLHSLARSRCSSDSYCNAQQEAIKPGPDEVPLTM